MGPAAAPRSASSPATGRRAGLDRDEVVQRALDIVEASGAEALSMRKLAADLGVTTTTIYWHVGHRDELLLAVVRRLAAQQAGASVVGDVPRDRVLSAATNIWDTARAHRNVTALARQLGATTLLELPLEVALAAELEAAGLRGPQVRDALRAVLMCIAGFLVGTWRPADQGPPELRPSALWGEVHDDRLSAATVAALAEPAELEGLFDRSLQAVVDAHLPTGRTGRDRRREGDR